MIQVCILEKRSDKYIIQTESGVSTVPRTAYFEIKYERFCGNRILYTFPDGIRVEETYNDGIFNAHDGARTVQLSDADKICRFIMSGDESGLRNLFEEWYSLMVQDDILREVFARYLHRVDMESEPGIYIIDDIFRVDSHGAAYFRSQCDWKFLCIVANSAMRNKTYRLPILGGVDVKSQTMVIMAKVMFLLNPDSSDDVFFSQLDESAKLHVRDIEEKYRRTLSENGQRQQA